MSGRKYKAVVIGCGRIAGGLEDDPLRSHPCTHMGAYRRFPEIEVTGCASRTLDEAREFAGRWDIDRPYTDYVEMLEIERPDIVSVCTPAGHHCEAVVNAARYCARAVFCEKAMATSLEEADAMIDACKQSGTKLTVNHTRRWCWDYMAVKKIIESGELGELHSVTGWFGGQLIHTGTHFFDAVHYLCGEAKTVWGELVGDSIYGEDGEIEDADGYAYIEMANGARVIVNGTAKNYYMFEMELLFSDGRVRVGNGVHELWRCDVGRHYRDFNELSPADFPSPGPGERNPLVLAVRDIMRGIEENRDSASTGKDARRALETAVAVFESHEMGGRRIELPLKETKLRIASR